MLKLKENEEYREAMRDGCTFELIGRKGKILPNKAIAKNMFKPYEKVRTTFLEQF